MNSTLRDPRSASASVAVTSLPSGTGSSAADPRLDGGVLDGDRAALVVLGVDVDHDGVELLADPPPEHAGLDQVDDRALVAVGEQVGALHGVG